jgi:hypothetical protein
MEEELKLLKDICNKLDIADIEYMITGSFALAFYSIPRMTRDIDIIINVLSKDVNKIIDLFKNDFYISQTAVEEAIRNTTMFNIIHNDTIMKIDFIIRKNEEYRLKEFSRRLEFSIDDTIISVVSPEDLILSKLFWSKSSGSELQLRDVRNIMKTVKNIDENYLKEWSKKLDLESLLKGVTEHE